MAPGLEQAGLLTHDVCALVAGDLHECPVYVHDQAPGVSDQHAFTGAVEDRSRLAQPIEVFLQGLLQLLGPGKARA